MILPRSTLFNVLFVAWTCLAGFLFLPALLSRSWSQRVAMFWVRISLWLLRVCCGLSHTTHGKEHLPATPCIIAPQHQSAWDTLALWQEANGPAFILKRELLWIPIFGWYLARTGHIAIDRSKGSAAMQQIKTQAQQFLADGRHILIFPEGTRRPYGAEVALRGGVAALYESLQIPLVPVTLDSGKYWARNAFIKRAGVIQLSFHAAIPPANSGTAVLDMLKQCYNTSQSR